MTTIVDLTQAEEEEVYKCYHCGKLEITHDEDVTKIYQQCDRCDRFFCGECSKKYVKYCCCKCGLFYCLHCNDKFTFRFGKCLTHLFMDEHCSSEEEEEDIQTSQSSTKRNLSEFIHTSYNTSSSEEETPIENGVPTTNTATEFKMLMYQLYDLSKREDFDEFNIVVLDKFIEGYVPVAKKQKLM